MGSGCRLKQVEKSGKSTTEVSRMIDDWIFNKKYRRIIKMKLIDGDTYDEIAGAFDPPMSVDQVKKIVKQGIDALKNHF